MWKSTDLGHASRLHILICTNFLDISSLWIWRKSYYCKSMFLSFNPRPDGVFERPPPVFPLSLKYIPYHPSFFPYLITHPFHAFPETFVPRSSQVRSPGQVKWSYLQESLWCYSSYSFWAINMKLSGYHKTISSYETYILDFWFGWPKVRSILWPSHYKAMGEKLNPFYTLQTRSFYH